MGKESRKRKNRKPIYECCGKRLYFTWDDVHTQRNAECRECGLRWVWVAGAEEPRFVKDSHVNGVGNCQHCGSIVTTRRQIEARACNDCLDAQREDHDEAIRKGEES